MFNKQKKELAHRQISQLTVVALSILLENPALAEHDPGIRGGLNNTAGYLQQRGIKIPHPPVISPNPKTGATINPNELASFFEGIQRAGQLVD